MKIICLRCRRYHLRICVCGRVTQTLDERHWALLRRAVKNFAEGIVTKHLKTARELEALGFIYINGQPFQGTLKIFAKQDGRSALIYHDQEQACETARKVIDGLTK